MTIRAKRRCIVGCIVYESWTYALVLIFSLSLSPQLYYSLSSTRRGIPDTLRIVESILSEATCKSHSWQQPPPISPLSTIFAILYSPIYFKHFKLGNIKNAMLQVFSFWRWTFFYFLFASLSKSCGRTFLFSWKNWCKKPKRAKVFFAFDNLWILFNCLEMIFSIVNYL